uniref:Uncharacterized protein LOC104213832 n=1 Tax=Nicotiana sylvestris TaxID=4096 RepID=A0A1U7V5L7_NICSY|nr:PREDICTED: uncharacterized protein LOC104213832 [Nicotiana sylvestris]
MLRSLQPVHRRQGPTNSNNGVISGPIRVAGDPTSRVDQERGPSSSRGLVPICGKMHSGVCYLVLRVCYRCGMRVHIQRHCRVSHQGVGRGTTQSSSPATATSSAPSLARGYPTPIGRGATRGGAQILGGPNWFYAMSARQTVEASPDVVTGNLG